MANDTTNPSVYKRGARDGLIMGAWFSAVFLLNVLSLRFMVAGLLGLILTLLIPVPVYMMMCRDYMRMPSMRFFSAVWMHGIVIFFCGSLLLAPVIYVTLRFITPDFLSASVMLAVDSYRQMATEVPEAAQMADTLQQMIDQHMLPSPISLAVTSIWTLTFVGSILSMILTLIVRTVCNRRLKNQGQQ